MRTKFVRPKEQTNLCFETARALWVTKVLNKIANLIIL